MNKEFRVLYFYLDLSHDEVLGYYKGKYKVISTMTVDNVRIEFPAVAIKSFVQDNGVHGLFSIEFDQNNKLVAICRVNT